jgi:GT2 family glycosyltransferase
MPAPVLSIVIVAWNSRGHLEPCLRSLEIRPDAQEREVFVVDNASEDGTAGMVGASFPGVRLFANERNLGFAAATNVGLRHASGRYALLLNPDSVVHPGALDALTAYADAHPEWDPFRRYYDLGDPYGGSSQT